MRANRYIPVILLIMISCFSCRELYEEHYNSAGNTVDMTLWEALTSNPDFSEFAALLLEHGLDTLFGVNGSYTLFIPNNNAFSTFNPDSSDVTILLQFHILEYVFNIVNVEHTRIARVSGGKYVHIESHLGEYTYNGVKIIDSSPLYKDGRIYELEEVAYPRQNLYEYIAQNTSVLRQYIDGFDSILLNLEESTPLGFDEEGNTIYDSVYTIVNYFDSLYFPLNEEHRFRTATFLLFDDEQYYIALDQMALDLGTMTSGEDIPDIWRQEVLIPDLLQKGLFPNSLQYEDFMPGVLKNIQGDSVEVDFINIVPDFRELCSNGVVFSYDNFRVPEYLYKGEVTIEGEHMVDSLGAGVYFWKPGFEVSGSTDAVSVNPIKNIGAGARNDSLVTVTFPELNYDGEYTLEFYFKNLFPQKYLFVWSANFRPSGTYQILVNDVMIKEFDTFGLRSMVFSVKEGEFYLPVNGYNKVDAWVDHLTEYGDVKVTLKYIAPGIQSTNGLNIDYISLIPEN